MDQHAACETVSVGVIGGGIAGLTLGQVLRAKDTQRKLAVTIFDRDKDPECRVQGWYLGLEASTLCALDSVAEANPGLRDALFSNNDYTTFSVRDGRGALLLRVPADGAFVYRPLLRKTLANGLEVQWNKQFRSFQEVKGGVLVSFDDGSSQLFDYVVGADGASSALRRQIAPDASYNDLGYTTVAGSSKLSAVPSCISSYLAAGLTRWLGQDGHTLMMFLYRHSDTDVDVFWVLSYPGRRDEWEARFAAQGENITDEYGESAHQREQLLSFCREAVEARFAPELAQVVAATALSAQLFGPRQVYSMDPRVISRLASHVSARVMLVGDAAHATTTHRGQGANTAVEDALDLADALLSPDQNAALRRCAVQIIKRGAQVAWESTGMTRSIHARGFLGATLPRCALWCIGGAIQGIITVLSFFSPSGLAQRVPDRGIGGQPRTS